MSREKKYSAEQYYIDLSDSLAALRSAKGFVYTIIAVMAVFTVLFNAVFCIYDVSSTLPGEEEQIAVLTNVQNRDFQTGDVLLIHSNGAFTCAEVSQTRKNSDGVYVKAGDGQRFVSDNDIAGKAEFILFPLRRFGSDTHILS